MAIGDEKRHAGTRIRRHRVPRRMHGGSQAVAHLQPRPGAAAPAASRPSHVAGSLRPRVAGEKCERPRPGDGDIRVYCDHCQTTVVEGAKFCPFCGGKLTERRAEAAEAMDPSQAPTVALTVGPCESCGAPSLPGSTLCLPCTRAFESILGTQPAAPVAAAVTTAVPPAAAAEAATAVAAPGARAPQRAWRLRVAGGRDRAERRGRPSDAARRRAARRRRRVPRTSPTT